VRIALLLTFLLLPACKPAGTTAGPPSTRTTSAKSSTLKERTDFLHQYVTFRRTYQSLDFDIDFKNNSRGVPAPNDYDIRLVAVVPADELQAWIPPGVGAVSIAPDVRWLATVPTTVNLSQINEWYEEPRRIIGVDRASNVVVYRAWKY
jgi:hypothetical protein